METANPEGGEPLLLVYWGRRGAGAQYLLHLARSLRERSARPVQLSLSRQSELFEETLAVGLPCLPVDTYSGAVSAAARSAMLPVLRRKLASELERRQIRISLVCMPHPWGWAVADVLRAGGRHLVTVVHDAVPHPGEKYPLPSWLLQREIGLSDGIITLSRHVSRTVTARYGYPPDRIFELTLPTLISATRDRPRTLDRGSRPARLLFLGRILPYKGLDILLDAMERLRGECPVVLNVQGSGITPALANRISGMPEVRLVDRWIPEPELPRILEDADLLVAPYREASQSGVVPAALAAGLPVVATPVGGLIEQVEHGRSGLIAEAASGEALARAIRSLVEDRSLYRRCAEGALEASQAQLSWNAHINQIEAVVREVTVMPRR